MLTKKEIDAIRFYQGDIRKRTGDASFSEYEQETGFFGIPGAYRTMNCLMFDGIENEKERIAEGTTDLNPQVFLEIEKVVGVFCDIFRAMCKSTKTREDNSIMQTLYRTDRGVSVREMKEQRRTISFTSTSKVDCPKEYFKKKKNLTLLEIIVPPDIPCLDFEKILGNDYYFADQKEILLPPFVHASIFEVKLTKEEEAYRDEDDLSPQGKFIIVLENIALPDQIKTTQECAAELLVLKEKKVKMAYFLEKMTRKEELTEQEIEEYSAWKREFKKIIIERFRAIQSEYSAGGDSLLNRRRSLETEISDRIKDFDECRKRYKNHMRICNLSLAAASVVPLLCVTLSFIQGIELHMKIAAAITSAVAMLLTRILKAEAYHLKLYQRTKTCLYLRDLFRQMKYEHDWSEEKVEEYVDRFRAIMIEDTNMSLQNLQLQIDNEGELFQNEIIS